AVDEPAWSDANSATTAVDQCRCIEVGNGIEPEQLESEEQTAQICLALVVPRPRQHLHHHRLGDTQPLVVLDQAMHPTVSTAARRAVVLNPRRRVGQNHSASRGAWSAGTSSIACAPRMA